PLPTGSTGAAVYPRWRMDNRSLIDARELDDGLSPLALGTLFFVHSSHPLAAACLSPLAQ
ncbi:hypothetical protein MWK27_26840, partial [Escherichia coli]